MTPKALVVDDDPDILQAVADILKSMGHECDCADSVESARKYLDGNLDQYSYVLLDLEIPVSAGTSFARIQNGENLLEEIIRCSGTQRKPVIVMTAHGKDGPELAVDVMKKGAVDYVTKPFNSTGRTLDKSIREALRQHDKSHSTTSAAAATDSATHDVIVDNNKVAEQQAASKYGLLIDQSTFSVSFRGRKPAAIGNRKEFRLLQALIWSANRFVEFATLAERMGGDSLDNLVPVKCRLVKTLRENNYDDLADCIETQKGHYGLILSSAIEK